MEPAQCLNLQKAEKNKSTLCIAIKRHEIGMEKIKKPEGVFDGICFLLLGSF